MKLPNIFDKREYLERVLKGKIMSLLTAPRVTEAALLCYHMEVPVEDAIKYVETFGNKLAASDCFSPYHAKPTRKRFGSTPMPY